MRRYLFASVISFAPRRAVSPAVAAPPAKAVPTPAEKPLLDVKSDAKTGKIIATLPKPGPDGVSARYIYITQLETGLGSAPTQLDFGAASNSRILVFRRVGKKVVAEVENSKFVTSNPAEQLTTEHSFPTSPLWMGDVNKDLPDGSYRGRPLRLPRARRHRHSARDQEHRRRRVQVRAGTQRRRSGLREAVSEERRTRRANHLPLGRAEGGDEQHPSRRQHA